MKLHQPPSLAATCKHDQYGGRYDGELKPGRSAQMVIPGHCTQGAHVATHGPFRPQCPGKKGAAAAQPSPHACHGCHVHGVCTCVSVRACVCQPEAVQSRGGNTKASAEVAAILQKKAWEKVAFQPLFMTAFMLWMSGTNLNIFSIITVVMAVYRPVSALMTMSTSTCTASRHHACGRGR